jgi:hypothetical protein
MHIGHGGPHISPDSYKVKQNRAANGAVQQQGDGTAGFPRRLPIFVPSSRQRRFRAATMGTQAFRRR